MKKIILGLTLALVLTGCQQQLPYTLEEETLIEETTQDGQEEIVEEEVEIEESTDEDREEQLLKISNLKDRLNQCQTKLLNNKKQFNYNSGWYFEKDDERKETVIEELNLHLSVYMDSEKQIRADGDFVLADAYLPYIENLKKEIKEVEAQWNEINSLLKEINDFEDEFTAAVWDYSVGEYREEIDLTDIPERVAVVEYRTENLEVIDVQSLTKKYIGLEGKIHNSVRN